MTNHLPIHAVPKRRVELLVPLAIALITLAASFLLIANPGFFNHDELQKADHILRYGLADYFKTYGVIRRDGVFGHPVRPLGFWLQGLFAIPMYVVPVATHLLDVLLHVVVSIVLYRTVRLFAGERIPAVAASLLFAMSPLAAHAVGWAGAIMDRLYVLFGLVCAYAALKFLRCDGSRWRWWALVFVATALALLSKETAVVLPLVMLLVVCGDALFRYRSVKYAPATLLVLASLLPVLAYLAYRFPALLNSLGASDNGQPYGVSVSHLLFNALTYWSYPFLPTLSEAVNAVFVSPWAFAVSAGMHLVLVGALGREFGWRWAGLYLLCFFVFLLPVLPVSGRGSHYLYGSAVPLSAALAALGWRAWSLKRTELRALCAVLVSVLGAHAAFNHVTIYAIGRCMDRALTSLEAVHASAGYPRTVVFVIDPQAPGHVIDRMITGRDQIGADYPVQFVRERTGESVAGNDDALRLQFSRSCLLYSGVDTHESL